jgi:hypothetical protein
VYLVLPQPNDWVRYYKVHRDLPLFVPVERHWEDEARLKEDLIDVQGPLIMIQAYSPQFDSHNT